MKRITIYIITFLSIVTARLFAGTAEYQIDFSKSDITIKKESDFDVIGFQDCPSVSDIGHPQLPVKSLTILLPANAKVRHIQVNSMVTEYLPDKYTVFPAQLPLIPGETASFAEPQESIYKSDQKYPSSPAELSTDGILFGYHIVNVLIYPLQYIPSEKTLILNKHIQFVVEYESDQTEQISAERRFEKSQTFIDQMVEELIFNKNDLIAYRPGVTLETFDKDQVTFLPETLPSSEGSAVDYLIITNDAMKSVFQQLADWKTRSGIPTVVKTVTEIKSSTPNGVDDAETIRSFIKKAYQKWGVTWVLLAGDVNIIPVRYVRAIESDLAISDMYYSDLTGNWNADGDNIWAERYVDRVDFYPDVFVGRAPVESVSEAQIFVNKTIAYQRGNGEHQNKLLYLGENMFVPGDGKQYCESMDAYTLQGTYLKTKLYEIDGNQNRSLVLSALNAGHNLIFNESHADAFRLAQGPPDNFIYQNDMCVLTNNNNFSIFYAVDCNANDIGYDDCFSENFMLNPSGGGVGYIGSTWNDYPSHSVIQNDKFFELLFENGVFELGRTFSNAKLSLVPYANSLYYRTVSLSYLLLGDPTLEIYTGLPSSFSVQKPASVEVGASSVTITVTQSDPVNKLMTPGSAVKDALVCFEKNGEVYATGITNSLGKVILDIEPNTTGTLNVIVKKHNYKPYEGQISVTSTSLPHAYYRSFQIDDSPENGWDGNSDGMLNAGEHVNFVSTIINSGRGDIYGDSESPITVELSSSSQYVTINNSIALIEKTIAGGDSDFAAFDLSIAPNCPDEEPIAFDVLITSQSGQWQDQFTIWVSAAEIKHILNVYEMEPIGQNKYYFCDFSIQNVGTGAAKNVSAALSLVSGSAVIDDNSHNYGELSVNQVKTGNFSFHTTQQLSSLKFLLTMTDYYGKTWTHQFDLVKPAVPTGLTFEPLKNAVRLAWTPNSTENDLACYAVYRSAALSEPYVKVSSNLLGRISFYEDNGLLSDSVYYYKSSAMDSSGNESALSGALKTWTQKNNGSLGWPIATGEIIKSDPTVVDIDGDGDMEIFIGGTDGKLYAFHHNGAELYDIDSNASTVSGFASIGSQIWSKPAVADFEGDGILEVIVTPRYKLQGSSTYQRVYAWHIQDANQDGRPDPVAGWPTLDSLSTVFISSPVAVNVDLDAQLEVIAMDQNGYVYVWEHNGVLKNGWPQLAGTGGGNGQLYGTVAVGNFDTDTQNEIVVCAGNRSTGTGSIYVWNYNGTLVSGWPFNCSGPFSASPVLADLDGDDKVEIVAASERDTVYVLKRNGSSLTGWLNGKFARLLDIITPTPAIGNIDADPQLEIVVSTEDGVTAWNSDGSVVTGFPVSNILSTTSPVIADVDGGTDLEILVGSGDRKVYAIKSNGVPAQGWPVSVGAGVTTGIAVSDMDHDGFNEMLLGCHDFKIYSLETTGSSAKIEWSMAHHDAANTGQYSASGSPAKATVSIADHAMLPKAYALYQNYPNPFNPLTSIKFALPKMAYVTLKIYNVLGQEVRTLANGNKPAGYYDIVWDGLDNTGKQTASGIYLYRLHTDDFIKSRKMILIK